ncbi:MAG TPA: HNH endonuclease signature motif containing protein, partial [Pseudonocardia sp.]|nr:HNH endonuclease signature motif containing protein [Pseudonocardia sp.]
PPDPAGPGPVEPAAAGSARATAGRAGIEVRVELSTLLGLDEHPGEVPGLGPVTAGTARRAVARQPRAEWRFAVTDAEGRAVFDGVTRRRPRATRRTGPRGGVVELHVPASLLAELTADGASRYGAWAGVITDLAEQYAHRGRRDLDSEPHARFPRAALRRHVQIRDRVCTFPGCRAPARRADADHTRDHALGGRTVAGELGAVCRHDHLLKQRGWSLEQPEPGVFVWTSPLGRSYRVRPEPVLPPLPGPVPAAPEPSLAEPAPRSGEPRAPRHSGRDPPGEDPAPEDSSPGDG